MGGYKQYPELQVNLGAIRKNAEKIVSLLHANQMTLTGVVKGCNGLPNVADQFVKAGCKHIASSRLDQLADLRSRNAEIQLMLVRMPMDTEIDDLVRIADISLNSEWETVEALADASSRCGKTHGVILMQDLGDLREGFFNRKELVDLAVHVETNLKGLILKGIGTNLGCYGAIKPSAQNLGSLVQTAQEIEKRIGRSLEIVSGGATSSLPLLLEGMMPKGINNLRIGEAILNNRDLPELWHVPVPGLQQDTFILKAKVIEVKGKPSHPVGEVFIDAFGDKPVFTDRGIRRRAILAVGKQDICDHAKLVPMIPGLEIVGSSSDHLIVDIEKCETAISVGDVLPFGIYYAPMLFLSSAQKVNIVYED